MLWLYYIENKISDVIKSQTGVIRFKQENICTRVLLQNKIWVQVRVSINELNHESASNNHILS